MLQKIAEAYRWLDSWAFQLEWGIINGLPVLHFRMWRDPPGYKRPWIKFY